MTVGRRRPLKKPKGKEGFCCSASAVSQQAHVTASHSTNARARSRR